MRNLKRRLIGRQHLFYLILLETIAEEKRRQRARQSWQRSADGKVASEKGETRSRVSVHYISSGVTRARFLSDRGFSNSMIFLVNFWGTGLRNSTVVR